MRRRLILSVIVAAVLLQIMCSCSVSSDITGQWECSETVLGIEIVTRYEFYDDGSGVRTQGAVQHTFSYTIEDGVLILSPYKEGEEPERYLLTKSGESLTLVDSEGVSRVYYKVARHNLSEEAV